MEQQCETGKQGPWENCPLQCFGVILLAPALMPAQAPPPDVVQALAANVQAFKNYCWKTRTMLVQRGETTSVKLEQVGFDKSGKLQKTLPGDPPKKSAAVRSSG